MKLQNLLAAILCAVASSASITSLAYAATLASATEESNPLEITIVTGARFSQPLKQSLFHASVITAHDIQDSQAVDVPSLLKNLAGVEFYQSGGIGKQSSLFLRGTNSSHVLVLLDGVRINSATSGTTAIDQLMLDQIERIEVVRGNVSSLYGSEAIGGVIQIFTKRGKGEPQLSISGGAGSHNTQRLAAGFGGEVGNTEFNVQVSKYKTDGVTAIKPAIVPTVNPDKDGYDNTSMLANVRYAFNDDHSLSGSVFDEHGEAGTDNPYGSSSDVNSSKSKIQKFALTSDNNFNELWQSKVQLAQGLDEAENFLNGSPDTALGALFKTTSNQIAWQNTLRWNAQHVTNFGLEHLDQDVASDTAFSKTGRRARSLFGGYSGNSGAHQMQLNLRSDHYSDFGTANTGLLGYGFLINPAWRASASAGTAYKAPTLNDLFYPYTDFGFGYTYQGNPGLKPERSRNTEIGIHYAANEQRAEVIYFDNRIRDLIVGNGQMAGTVINLAEARSDGFELAYAGQFADTGVKAALTFQNPRDVSTGQVLLRRAKSFGNIGITQNMGAWQVGGEVQYSNTREDYDINTYSRTTLESYSVVNLSASYAVDTRLTVTARADNLFDKDYMLAHGYNTPGRTLFIGLNYKQ